jgi:hypothetical protein
VRRFGHPVNYTGKKTLFAVIAIILRATINKAVSLPELSVKIKKLFFASPFTTML